MVELDNVAKSYSDQTVLHGLSLKLDAGKTFVLIGPSGCGKSTILRLIVGLIQPDVGSVVIDGKKLATETATELRRRMGYVIQEGGLFPHLSAKGNAAVMARYLKWKEFGIQPQVEEETVWTRLTKRTLEHIDLVRQSLLPAILLAIPLGILAMKRRRVGQVVLASVAIVQTIPALALLVFLMAPVHALGLGSVGQGSLTAVAALFLYSLLPIVRNTYAGLNEISPGIHESAVALGLSSFSRLRLIELPLASRTILAGIKTAAVVNVGFATLGALIGAGVTGNRFSWGSV